jgi:ribosome-associated protein
VAKAAAERKAEDIVLLNLSGVSSFCDGFVLCSGSNRRQVRAIAEGIIDELRKLKIRPMGVEGLDASRWVLIDFGDIVVHVFDEPMRGFYDLDALWADAPRIPFEADGPAAPRLEHVLR